ncbi:unnamed protein product [Symbiodinium pilosum]|uniref:Uncharacterized protein n=1 Tax=Symbiodinium pilosum TaxID=2952 RepID=A0A812RY18_SYMPI|nr:unnamed protein product [Symbiodinium pilosum]
MASRMQAVKSVTRTMIPRVKPAVDLGLNTSQKNDKAALALINPVKDLKPKYPPGGHAYVWGVTWPGHSDKWGNEEAPFVDWEEVGEAFKVWKDIGIGSPFDYLKGYLAVLSEVASSKLPTKSH